VTFNSKETVIKLPFIKGNKNHLGSLYFGALSIGADLSGGLSAMYHIKESQKNIHLSFKDFHAEFLKRPMHDTYFYNSQGDQIALFVQEVIKNQGTRMNFPLEIIARCPDISEDPVANFQLTLSLKLPTRS